MNPVWPFQDPEKTAVFTTKQVVEEGKPIVHVTHDAEDGAWQFHSGDDAGETDATILALSEIVAMDSTISELAGLPLGGKAWRETKSGNWKRRTYDRRNL